MNYTIISADSHVIEPRDLFVERMPGQYRDRAPRVVRGRDGGDGWSFDGSPPARTFGLEAVAGRKAQGEKFGAEGLTWDEILPGNYDGAAHLTDMDRDGVDASVLYAGPIGLSSFSLPDRDLGLAVMRTYNDWLLDDFCGVDRDRLVGLAVLPTDDGADVMLAEFERCVGKGARGFNLPGSPGRARTSTSTTTRSGPRRPTPARHSRSTATTADDRRATSRGSAMTSRASTWVGSSRASSPRSIRSPT